MLLADIERVKAGGRVLDGTTPEALALLRQGMARDIQTVWVRPPARRSKSLPIADRVRIVWQEDGEEVELPTRGAAFKPKPYVFPDGSISSSDDSSTSSISMGAEGASISGT